MECLLSLLPLGTKRTSYSLNPYSNGMLTIAYALQEAFDGSVCLNPYSNGMLTIKEKIAAIKAELEV